MVYKLKGADKYSETLPTATEVGDYVVCFMVQGNKNYNDIKEQTLKVSIKEPESSSSNSSSSIEISSGHSSSSKGNKDAVSPVVANSLKVRFMHNELSVIAPVASNLEVLVFDLQGNIKKQYQAYTAGTHYVSLDQMNSGMYLVRVVSGGSVQMLRVQVK